MSKFVLISDENSPKQGCKHWLMKHQLVIHWPLLLQLQHLTLWEGRAECVILSRFSFILPHH